ncbi:hypothetical protein JAAARDRAFT_57926 [Jaapia argillacea MUCL 33604]|uniref:HNH domain-containing protein n=1 Tax=Jaapia argillacea MUCL 33604 TaxID=933084 RepID=A0A067Q6E7_9AGAM|nr:hypothetical protein JAAARDRAFT_57926 [Jaapia argillacea MUCL 33604]
MQAEPETTQFLTFKDCLARRLIIKAGGPDTEDSSIEELGDFISYLALELWPTLPESIRNASYTAIPSTDELSFETLTPPTFIDSLISYGLVGDSDDVIKFVEKVLDDYVKEACEPPPTNWSGTRKSECEICERAVPLTYHHLIPRSVHTKVLKKGWHREEMLGSVAWLCRHCHSTVHHVASNEELARNFYTVDLLLEREDIQKWRNYAAKQRRGKRRG